MVALMCWECHRREATCTDPDDRSRPICADCYNEIAGEDWRAERED